MTAILALLRERTQALVPLPADEEFALELVAGEPWAAFNYYLGRHRSRIVVNTDLPFSGAEIVHLAAHEGYPGHHTEHATKEELLLERRKLALLAEEELSWFAEHPAVGLSRGHAKQLLGTIGIIPSVSPLRG